jgi:UDP-perosamine 4-acetyltransferase
VRQVPVILLGAGGHAKVVLDLLQALDRQVLGVCDPGLADQGIQQWRGLPVLGNDEAIEQHDPNSIALANGTGSLPGNHLRRRLHAQFTRQGYHFTTLVHPSATLGSGVELGQDVQVMAGVIVQADTRIGDDVILNTGACIDHDGVIGNHVHIAPGAVLSGDVRVADGCHIGPGAVIIQGVRLGQGAVIGAGTTVLSDLLAHHQQTGQPPRPPVDLNTESNTA